ncbi:Ig-like domain-containing protein [Candidatus Poribacteria bacterium]|nr:Ig-like domain-containing protein [Candidatus Poribacteria bacterium]
MKLYFRTLAIVMAALLAVYIVGCGGDDDDEEEAAAAAFVSASPASGDLAANGSISVTFDNNPGDVTASAGTVAGSGKSRTISGPFDVGALALNLTWTNGDGSHTLNYNIVAADEDAPEVTASSPEDGAEGVDPAGLFEDGIEVTFNENVSGDLMLMDGDDDVGWTSEASDNKITLTGNAGQELSNETEYKIAGTVKDGAGNEAEVSISFVTKAKE